jgi:hypothetical protein
MSQPIKSRESALPPMPGPDPHGRGMPKGSEVCCRSDTKSGPFEMHTSGWRSLEDQNHAKVYKIYIYIILLQYIYIHIL